MGAAVARVSAAPYTVTGQWDFKFGDLRATIGADLQYIGDTSNFTTFTDLKVGGQLAQVMSFGANSTNEGFLMRHGAPPNGGGQFVNQYTIVMDVMYPSGVGSQPQPLLATDPSNPPGGNAQFYESTSPTQAPSGIGTLSQMSGGLAPNTWYRIAFAVDLTAPDQQLTEYIDALPVGRQVLAGGVDGSYALGPTLLLFTTGTITAGAATQDGYVNSIQFVNSCMTADQVAALGSAAAAGIPWPGSTKLQIGRGNWQVPTTKFSWPGRYNPSLQVQITTNLDDTNAWQSLGGLSSTRSLTVPAIQATNAVMFLRVAGTPVTNIQPGLTPEADVVVGALPSGVTLPTKQIVRAAGQSVRFLGAISDEAMSPDGATVYVKNNTSLFAVDIATWGVVGAVRYSSDPGSSHGIATSPDGSHVYVSGMFNALYDFVVAPNRSLTLSRSIALPTNCNPEGIAISSDGSTAYVCLGYNNVLAVVNLTNGTVAAQIPVGNAPWGVKLSPDGLTAYVTDWAGRRPTNGDLTQPTLTTPIVVDSRGIAASGALSIVDLNQNVESAEVPTGLHPGDLTLSGDGGTVYIANANSDTVTVINTQSRAVQETISTRPDPTLPFGSQSDAVALSPDGTTLYVANAGNNAVAVVQLAGGSQGNSVIEGFIPTDCYPGALLVDSSNLYVANVRGLGSTNFSVTTLTCTVNKIPLPASDVLDKYSATVQENGRIPQMLAAQAPAQAGQSPVPVPTHAGEPSVFQHVLYIIKENKTYDQVLGDIQTGNGNPKLCIYPQNITPNQHALALQYVLLDNYYCNGILSGDGHSWCTEANATEYWEKSVPSVFRNGHQGGDPLIYASSGLIWDNVLAHGLTFTNFGEFGLSTPVPSTSTWKQVYADYTNHTGRITYNTYIGNAPVLPKYSSPNVSGFNTGIPDQVRVDAWLKEFNGAQSNGFWPTFNILYLPNDHTAGGSPGFPTPRAMVADNDLALGRAVEAVTKSVFASNTVIFVIEDDPQSGFDHVDGHRSMCLVISPYTKRGQTVSTFFNQVGLIHTMEQIMGLPPMNQMDAMGPLMGDCFTTQPDFTPYTAVPNNIALNEMNPGTTGSMSREDKFWAMQSAKMDFSKPDQVNDDILNRIIWHSIKGHAHYPSEFVGTHGTQLAKLGLVATKNRKDDDDD